MGLIADAFAHRSKRAALLTFVTAGFPRADSTPSMLHAMVRAGADIVEVGVPFSDPMADGPAIQRSSERALANGMTLSKTLAAVAEFRADNRQTPVVLMGYVNSFLNHRGGVGGFSAAAKNAGVNGLIAVDLSDSGCAQWRPLLNQQGVDLIRLIAPTTAESRMRQLAESAQGFAYVISLKGVTGAGHLDLAAASRQLTVIRRHATTPVVAGFGVRTAEHVRTLAPFVDGVVVGSRLVEAAEAVADEQAVAAVGATTAELAAALPPA